ncbi:MAG: hypothetical protein V1929_00290 [bacterium]
MAKVKDNAIVAITPATDHSTKEGYFVETSSGNAEVCNAATDLPTGVIVDGEVAAGKDSVALMNYAGTVHAKLSGTVAALAKLQLAADGTLVTDAGSGARVLVAQALEAGVSGDLIEVALYGPIVYAS